ncbi:NAD(P)H-hydrate dehydratase [Croceicoccus sp. F390]|uniref:Bifunctional NAD(P)H-hydrate repair enzyme n=1 Tax=Croceicoccus esteveae TaxID=3075597 RepID=A0ABU2ZFA7_9SPHN|nr:NAD(P)H-hydrate dehydratase [Croceicoccus sp. F390]MDT0575291.1 NAD(P)H-hydrate dehydratase [Croceicoccus sp. F390]
MAQMRSAEQQLIDSGTDVHTLMQRAGRGAAEYVRRMAAGASVTVLCGPGNNGGDGYVIAQALREAGNQVRVVAAMPPATDAAQRAAALYAGPVVQDGDATGALLVDCLFGSGLNRPLESDLHTLLTRLSAGHDRLVAIDLPSGIDADSGALLTDHLPQAALCLALGAWKPAHFLMPAIAHWRTMRLVDIGITLQESIASIIVKPQLCTPAMDAHKYTRGLVVVVAGRMSGAGLLAAQAAMHAGAGYVKLLAAERMIAPPADLVTMDTSSDSSLGEQIDDERISALVTGPGLGRDAHARGRLKQALTADRPTVLDADGLTILAPEMLRRRTAPLIVTPHAGEMQALEHRFDVDGGCTKPARALEVARALNAVVVFKGADTVVAAPDGRIAHAPPASGWLSAAGTGDVLAGIVAARLAVTGDPWKAAVQGVWLHGEAARICGPAFTAGTLAHKVQDALACAL